MEIIYLVVFFRWTWANAPTVAIEKIPQASMNQCYQNGKTLKAQFSDFKDFDFACIKGIKGK